MSDFKIIFKFANYFKTIQLIMKKTSVFMVMFFAATVLISCGNEPARLLILSGQNNHRWQETTPLIREILTRNGTFTVDITERPDTMTAAMFKSYDVIVSNQNTYPEQASTWGTATKQAFLDFMSRGGGFVCIHSASYAHYDWPPFLEICGARWGEKTHHGPISDFTVQIINRNHPITKGIQDFPIRDELWVDMECHPSMEVLCAVQTDEYKHTPGKREPVVLTTRYGKGRGYYLVLGHDATVMAHPDWQKLLLQGTAWAAKMK